MISYLIANSGSSIEELKRLPFHEFRSYITGVNAIKQQEYKDIVGDDLDGNT